ncbi:MAG: Gldg family protein [Clostridia bacterium]|nr:Gldg family protein [Clostridia bacterium]
MPKATSKKTFRHGSVSVLLTVAVVAAAILSNAIVTALAMRYGWFINMNPDYLYPVTDICYDYLDTYVIPETADGDKIEIVFCDNKENVVADSTQAIIHNTALELAESYPNAVEISYLNVWERPKVARSYGVTASTDVVVKCGESFRVCTLRDFFSFSVSDNSTPLAYNGEKRLAVAMKAVVSSDAPVAYFTLNHGESFPDYSLLFAATDAGYMVNYLDALSFDIPEDCGLLITYNPAQDFTTYDGVSGTSEIEKLEAYMDDGGKYMVFVSADTFNAGGFDNLEGFLSERGVTFDHREGTEGVEECNAIRDLNHALSTDGYTLVGKIPETGKAAEIMADIKGTIRLSNATAITPAEGFAANGNGSFVKGNYTITPLLTSYEGAEAWAGGRAVARTAEGFNLITLTEDKSNGSYLLVSTSTEFASEAAMQSGVYDNESFLLTALGAMGKTDTPVELAAQPFAETTIYTLTTASARNITIALTAVPTLVVLAAGLIILIRRKFA